MVPNIAKRKICTFNPFPIYFTVFLSILTHFVTILLFLQCLPVHFNILQQWHETGDRSSQPRCSIKNGVFFFTAHLRTTASEESTLFYSGVWQTTEIKKNIKLKLVKIITCCKQQHQAAKNFQVFLLCTASYQNGWVSTSQYLKFSISKR